MAAKIQNNCEIAVMFFELFRNFASVMRNPLSILRLLMKAKRPSRTVDMPAVSDTFWLRSGYEALTFFGFIVTHTQREADHINHHYDELKNHEMIHLRQAQTTGDSWLWFYILYSWYWMRGLCWSRRMKHAAYLLNPFEMEAYKHMHDFSYVGQHREGADEWREYAKMNYEERRAVYDSFMKR